MRIAFVNVLYGRTSQRGGLGEHIADVSQELAHRGHDVTIVTAGIAGESREGLVTVARLGPVEPFARASQLLSPSYAVARLRYMARLRRRMVAGRFDVIEAADGGFEHLFLLWRRPGAIVTKLHGNFRQIHPRRWLVTRAIGALEAAAVRASDGVYASTSRRASEAANEYRVSAERINVVPCGVRHEELGQLPSVVERFPQLRDRQIVLLSVGNSPGRKGARVFLDAAAAATLKNVTFVLVATGTSWLRGPVPPNVVVLPTQDRQTFRALMAAASVVGLPSSFESFSIATHEAMLLGKRLIVSDEVPLDAPAADYPRMVVLDRIDVDTLAKALGVMFDDQSPVSAPVPAATLRLLEDAYGITGVGAETLRLYQAARARCAERRHARERLSDRRTAEHAPAPDPLSGSDPAVSDTE